MRYLGLPLVTKHLTSVDYRIRLKWALGPLVSYLMQDVCNYSPRSLLVSSTFGLRRIDFLVDV